MQYVSCSSKPQNPPALSAPQLWLRQGDLRQQGVRVRVRVRVRVCVCVCVCACVCMCAAWCA